MCLHRIPGLARHFIYFNDDVFLGRAVRSSDFFLPGGGQAFYLQDTLVPGNDRQASARDQACGYTQTVLTRLWGEPQTPRFLPAHAPQAYDRDRLAQMESRLHEDFRRTAFHRFRAGDDLVLSVLYAHTLREAPEERNRHEVPVLPPNDYCFLMLENKWLWVMRAYAKILRRRPRFFCIDDDMGDVNMARLSDVPYSYLGIGFTPGEFCVLEPLTNVQDCTGARSQTILRTGDPMHHAEAQPDPTLIHYPAAHQPVCPMAAREALKNRATRLYLMGELAAAAALFLQLSAS
jgi:hypothetical protein